MDNMLGWSPTSANNVGDNSTPLSLSGVTDVGGRIAGLSSASTATIPASTDGDCVGRPSSTSYITDSRLEKSS